MNRIFRSRVLQLAKRSNLFTLNGNNTIKVVPPCVNPASESAFRSVDVKQYASGPEGDHRPSDFDKRVLVWSGFYKNVQEVPEMISTSKLLKSRDWFRIRVSIWMIIITVVGCVYMAWSGKQMLAEGRTIPKMARERAEKLREDHKAETVAKAEAETKT